jgi:hypothetical protein
MRYTIREKDRVSTVIETSWNTIEVKTRGWERRTHVSFCSVFIWREFTRRKERRVFDDESALSLVLSFSLLSDVLSCLRFHLRVHDQQQHNQRMCERVVPSLHVWQQKMMERRDKRNSFSRTSLVRKIKSQINRLQIIQTRRERTKRLQKENKIETWVRESLLNLLWTRQWRTHKNE